jgi:hypothetical protein
MKKIKFKDRDDLIEQLIVRKRDIPNATKVIDDLTKSLERFKRGDKDAVRQIIKTRRKIFGANAEMFIELEEDEMHGVMAANIDILDLIDEDDED